MELGENSLDYLSNGLFHGIINSLHWTKLLDCVSYEGGDIQRKCCDQIIDLCPFGYFGTNCLFRCHCENLGEPKACLMSGECFKGDTCEKYYFGNLCQYRSISHEVNDEIFYANDWNIHTCNKRPPEEPLVFRFKSIGRPFHYVRIQFDNINALQDVFRLKDVLEKSTLELLLQSQYQYTVCSDLQFWIVSSDILELYCPAQRYRYVDALKLSGKMLAQVCEVYISGGRDIAALSAISYYSGNKEIDIRDDLSSSIDPETKLLCTSAKSTRSSLIRRYTFKFTPVGFSLVIRHNKGKNRLNNFGVVVNNDRQALKPLQDDDENSTILFRHVHHLEHIDVLLSNAERREVALSMCGVEVYGDCEKKRYGLGCLKSCHDCEKIKNKCDLKGSCYTLSSSLQDVRIYTRVCASCAKSKCEGGSCSAGCIPGSRGENCLEECGRCGGNLGCDQHSGKCIEEECEIGFAGPRCTLPCGMCSDKRCEGLNRTCTSKQCVAGFKGRSCTQTCFHCGGRGECNIETGACFDKCNAGYRGDVCLLACTNCAGRGACDQKTGQCEEGCNYGFTGLTCSEKCSNCLSELCNKTTGECLIGCQHGFRGPKCDQPCRYCKNQTCLANGVCSEGCIIGYYGKHCERVCHNCGNDGSCHYQTGHCLHGCIPSFYGTLCSEACGNCAGDSSCNEKGKCQHGCKAGFKGETCKGKTDKSDHSTLSSGSSNSFNGDKKLTGVPGLIEKEGVPGPKEDPKFIQLANEVIKKKRESVLLDNPEDVASRSNSS
ncbi:multiple epidermal growth factor-like domains protein 6 isoform X3 [Biomphalaria glabrata]|uniref:Multiple epidermal growth factor-like domains protein 6 isoform X3 n=1 Tax=Biomphalaria glabrata TaxID=6526 RepID=A0A9W3ACM9_BIOGL|nr:multiple epidermal growth factor-like domains protein 6 isoform X3 [Biomphalaria glabrata]